MSKKSVEYIREVHKTGKRKNKVKAKSNFCQFCVGESMKKEKEKKEVKEESFVGMGDYLKLLAAIRSNR